MRDGHTPYKLVNALHHNPADAKDSMVLTTRGQARKDALAVAENVTNEESSSKVALSTTSDVDASSSSSSSSSDEEESKDETDYQSEGSEEEDIDALFAQSLDAMRKREKAEAEMNGKEKEEGKFESNDDVIRFDNDLDEVKTEKDASKRTKKYGKSSSKADAKAERQLDIAFTRLRQGGDVGENKAKSIRAQQKERREEREKSAGKSWFDMPAFPGAKKTSGTLTNPAAGNQNDGRGPSADEMRREVQAIRLRNAIDPKRFYRSSASGDTDMPKYAQLGRIISSNTAPAATMTRSERGRTVIDELVRDTEAAGYAKRKFNEQQEKSNVGWSSHVRRHPGKKGRGGGGGGKRQRR